MTNASRRLLGLASVLLTVACGDSNPFAAPVYAVTGTVAGLTGTVVLQNNGSDDLTLTSDGPFAFATKMSMGSSYEVSVWMQPATQTCAVTNGMGIVGSVAVVGITVTCTTNN